MLMITLLCGKFSVSIILSMGNMYDERAAEMCPQEVYVM